MRLLVVALLAAAATAQERDPFLDLVWRVGPDGEVRAWPDWRRGAAMEDTFEPRPLFPALVPKVTDEDPEPERFADVGANEAFQLVVALLLSGPTDLASLTDAEHHLRKLRLPIDPPYLVWPDPPRAKTDPLRRREQLDRILGLRRLGLAWPDWADAPLEKILANVDADPFLRAAAEQVMAANKGTAVPRAEAWTPDGLPAACALYATIDHRAIPPAPGMPRHLVGYNTLMARSTVLAMGAAASWDEIVGFQWRLDRSAEFPYELARRFGNFAPRRTWVACSAAPGLSLAVHVDGLFETDPLRAAAAELGAPVEDAGKGVRVKFGDAYLVVSPTVGELRTVPSRPLLDDAGLAELKAAGLGGGDAVWIHLRDTTVHPLMVDLGIERATLRASFNNGVTASIHAACRDGAAATRLADHVRDLLARLAGRTEPAAPVDPIPHDPKERERFAAFVRAVDVKVDGPWVAITFHREGETPWSVFRACLEG